MTAETSRDLKVGGQHAAELWLVAAAGVIGYFAEDDAVSDQQVADAVDLVLDGIPDHWVKVDGKWVEPQLHAGETTDHFDGKRMVEQLAEQNIELREMLRRHVMDWGNCYCAPNCACSHSQSLQLLERLES